MLLTGLGEGQVGSQCGQVYTQSRCARIKESLKRKKMEMMLLRGKIIIPDKLFTEDEPKDTFRFISVRIPNLCACSGFLNIGIFIHQHKKQEWLVHTAQGEA